MTAVLLNPPMERAQLLRVIDVSRVCVLLRETGAIVQAELSTPLSPRSHVASQSVNALASVPARISLGPYNISKYMFTDCHMEADLPEPRTTRHNYASRLRTKKVS